MIRTKEESVAIVSATSLIDLTSDDKNGISVTISIGIKNINRVLIRTSIKFSTMS